MTYIIGGKYLLTLDLFIIKGSLIFVLNGHLTCHSPKECSAFAPFTCLLHLFFLTSFFGICYWFHVILSHLISVCHCHMDKTKDKKIHICSSSYQPFQKLNQPNTISQPNRHK